MMWGSATVRWGHPFSLPCMDTSLVSPVWCSTWVWESGITQMLCVMQMSHKRMGAWFIWEKLGVVQKIGECHTRETQRACGKGAGSWGEDGSKPMLVKRRFLSICHLSLSLLFSSSLPPFLSHSYTHSFMQMERMKLDKTPGPMPTACLPGRTTDYVMCRHSLGVNAPCFK